MDGDFSLAAHVESIASRSHGEGERLSDALIGQTWPGGHGDRSERGALDWVRRWTPRSVRIEPVSCGCATGRCAVCN